MGRDTTFDRVRAFAIVLMVMANSVDIMREGYHFALWFRLLASIPAPIFTIVAGLMCALWARKRSYQYGLARGAYVLSAGIFVDVAVYGLIPLQSMDILYLIGTATPLIYFANRLKTPVLVITIGVVFVLTAILQQTLGYHPMPTSIALDGTNDLPGNYPSIWKHWIIDGWFPLFPWVGFGFVGIVMKRFAFDDNNQRIRRYTDARMLLFSACMLGCGAVISLLLPTPHIIRYGFVEWFYPASFGYSCLAIGTVGFLLAICDWSKDRRLFSWFDTLGSMTLAMYVLHLAIIAYPLKAFFAPVASLTSYLLLVGAHVMVLMIIAQGLKMIREKYQALPTVISWAIGK